MHQELYTRVFAAVRRNNLQEIVNLFNENEFLDINKTQFNSNTILHDAVIRCKPETVIKLLDMGADFNAVDVDGWKPIHFAALLKQSKIIKILLSRGADMHSRTVMYKL